MYYTKYRSLCEHMEGLFLLSFAGRFQTSRNTLLYDTDWDRNRIQAVIFKRYITKYPEFVITRDISY